MPTNLLQIKHEMKQRSDIPKLTIYGTNQAGHSSTYLNAAAVRHLNVGSGRIRILQSVVSPDDWVIVVYPKPPFPDDAIKTVSRSKTAEVLRTLYTSSPEDRVDFLLARAPESFLDPEMKQHLESYAIITHPHVVARQARLVESYRQADKIIKPKQKGLALID